jgi:hypothetical protein
MLSSPSRNIFRRRGIISNRACTLRLFNVCAVMSISIFVDRLATGVRPALSRVPLLFCVDLCRRLLDTLNG